MKDKNQANFCACSADQSTDHFATVPPKMYTEEVPVRYAQVLGGAAAHHHHHYRKNRSVPSLFFLAKSDSYPSSLSS